MDLASERCEACHKDSPQVPPEDEQALLVAIPEWTLMEVKGVKRLRRVIRVESWRPAMALTNRIADLADETDHHPRLVTEWGRVTVDWWTHAIRGLHRNDFVMAARVDALLDAD